MCLSPPNTKLCKPILRYAQEIGWTYVLWAEVEKRWHFGRDDAAPKERALPAPFYFGDLKDKKFLRAT